MDDFGNIFNGVEQIIDNKGGKYAAAKSTRYLCEKEEKQVWSSAYLNAKRGGTTIKDAEAMAYCDEGYKERCKLTARSIENELNARKDYDIALAKQEAARSLCSQETAKIKLQ